MQLSFFFDHLRENTMVNTAIILSKKIRFEKMSFSCSVNIFTLKFACIFQIFHFTVFFSYETFVLAASVKKKNCVENKLCRKKNLAEDRAASSAVFSLALQVFMLRPVSRAPSVSLAQKPTLSLN